LNDDIVDILMGNHMEDDDYVLEALCTNPSESVQQAVLRRSLADDYSGPNVDSTSRIILENLSFSKSKDIRLGVARHPELIKDHNLEVAEHLVDDQDPTIRETARAVLINGNTPIRRFNIRPLSM
jgi:hypothetical protein